MAEGKRRAEASKVCQAVRLLADGLDAEAVARTVRVQPETLAAWAADPDFDTLRRCLVDSGRLRGALDALTDLTPGAIAALRRALDGDDVPQAIRAAQEVLKYAAPLAHFQPDQTIRVEYGTPDHQPVAAPPWSARHPASPGPLQGGGVRSPLREDRDGQDSGD
jgi:hypothetical protein